MYNNKGQSLVAFVLILPIFLFIFILTYDLGNMTLSRRTLDNINYITIDYALSHLEDIDLEEKINNIINKNDSKIIIKNYKIENNTIYIETEKKYKGIFIGLINTKISKITSSYKGYINEDKKIIERNK